MNHRLPADVPQSGKRFDLTLTNSGLDNRKREIAQFVIDNGESKGVNVSLYLNPKVKEALMELFALTSDQVSAEALDVHKYNMRISAIIDVERLAKDGHGTFRPVNEEYNATNVWVNYKLTELSDAVNPTEFGQALKSKETKFKRKPSSKKES